MIWPFKKICNHDFAWSWAYWGTNLFTGKKVFRKVYNCKHCNKGGVTDQFTMRTAEN